MVPTVSTTGPTEATPETVKLPAPTAWPITLAFGITLLFAGMLTSASVSLLAASASGRSYRFDIAALSTFHLSSFSLALLIHLLTSLLVGLLYGAMLPMFPRRPVLLGGIVAPILWTGLLHSILGIINPRVEPRIDWPWFIASQFAFGIIAGCV